MVCWTSFVGIGFSALYVGDSKASSTGTRAVGCAILTGQPSLARVVNWTVVTVEVNVCVLAMIE